MTCAYQVRRGKNERGFALLIVFLLAAVVALMLYQQLPRVAFESQREKEQLLIDRGEQYKRGIQMYFVAFKKYPSKIEDLENTNNQRFLRRRYIDPMTGKDEWRLIHVNAAGQLTDSQVQKPPSPNDKNPQNASGPNAPGTLTTTGATPNPTPTPATAGTGTADPNAPPEVNAAVFRRPSDRPLIPGSGANQNAPTSDPNDPRNWPPIFLTPAQGTPGTTGQPGAPNIPGQQQLPGQQNLQQQFGNQPYPAQQYPGQQYPGQQNPAQQYPAQQYPAQQYPGQTSVPGLPGGLPPGLPGQIQNPQIPGQNPANPGQTNPINPNQLVPTIPGQSFNPQAGNPNSAIPGGGSNQAVGMINNMLRQPTQTADSGSAFNNTLGAGGLAGVATSFKGPSIKVYKDRQKYNEWEFIFDLKQGLPGQQQPQTGNGLAPPGQGPTGSNQPSSSPTASPNSGTFSPTPTQPNQP